MSDRSSWGGLFRRAARVAGRRFERVRSGDAVDDLRDAYRKGKRPDLPTNDDGEARIVCRRYAERRAVAVDAAGRPACFEDGHPDCEGCATDVREGRVETW